MSRQKGAQRLQVARLAAQGLAVLALGALLPAGLFVSQNAGYGPVPPLIHLYPALWQVSLPLTTLGGALLGLGWAMRRPPEEAGNAVRGLQQ